MSLTLKQAADFLSIEPTTLIKWVKADDTIPHAKLGGELYFLAGDLERWIRGRYTRDQLSILPPEKDRLMAEIIAGATRVDFTCGVYVLLNRKTVVYVGQSINVFSRLGEHHRNKIFDSYYVFPCAVEELDAKEAKLIRMFRPLYNTVYPSYEPADH